jgi:XTP/dITP diphosphohydrolase
MPNQELLIGTGNRGKITEIKRSFQDLPQTLRLIHDFSDIQEPDECGGSYAENAIIKARSYAEQTGLATLADDSGLEVAALDGLPGLRSARFGGEGLSDADRTNLLLSKLLAISNDERTARFVCVVAIANAAGEIINVSQGTCDGRITRVPAGDEGFGYDPIFIPSGHEKTFGEMPFSVKIALSHRGKALAATREFLERLVKC